MPEIALDARAQDDLELALAGVGDGKFMTGSLGAAGAGEVTRLVDAEGAPLADLHADGTVTAVAERVARPFEEWYRALPASGERLTVPVDGALGETALAGIAEAAAGREVVLAALVGEGSPRGCSAVELIRATAVAADMLRERGVRAEVVAVPLTRATETLTDPAEARADASSVAAAATDAARSRDDVVAEALAVYAAGEVFRPGEGGSVPQEIAAAARSGRSPAQGVVILFSGLSGSGKSTIARGVRNALLESGARAVTLLDGDVVRRNLSAGLGFGKADRETNVARIGWVAAEIARHGGIALASPIAPFAATRAAVREMVRDAGGVFLLVHVATPLEECERRDRKGLYARARAGEIPDFTGISSPYEEPEDAELVVDTTDRSVAEAVGLVLERVAALGLGPAAPRARGISAPGASRTGRVRVRG